MFVKREVTEEKASNYEEYKSDTWIAGLGWAATSFASVYLYNSGQVDS